MIQLNRYYGLLNLLVITVVCYSGVRVFYTIAGANLQRIAPPRVETSAASNQIVKTEQSRQPFENYREAIKRNLFGEVPPPPPPPPPRISAPPRPITDMAPPEPPRPVNLDVVLAGTISGDPETAAAIIGERGGKNQKMYRQGDDIQGATVESIQRERVVLNLGNGTQVLELGGKNAGPGAGQFRPGGMANMGSAGAMGGAESMGMRQPVAPRLPEAQPSTLPPLGTTGLIQLNRGEVARTLSDLSQVMTQARVRMHYDKGKADGLMLSSIQPGSMMQKMGLQNGDILQRIDGEPISTTDELKQLYEDLKAGNGVSLDIYRQGRRLSNVYEFR